MPAGRPTKLTKELQQEILNYVMCGNYIETACLAAGIDKKTYYNWKNRGEKAKSGIYKEFFHALKEAEAKAEMRFMEKIRQGEHNWQSAGWYLERKHPERWALRQRIQAEVTGKAGGKIEMEHVWKRILFGDDATNK